MCALVRSTWVIFRQSIKILVGLETFLFTELNTIKLRCTDIKRFITIIYYY